MSPSQQKRIIIIFGDGSFSASMPGKLSSNFRDIRKKLLEKSEMLGCFPETFHIPELRGKKRLVVLDIDEFKTSINWSDPSLPPNSPVHPIKHVKDIYAVVAYKGTLIYSDYSHY